MNIHTIICKGHAFLVILCASAFLAVSPVQAKNSSVHSSTKTHTAHAASKASSPKLSSHTSKAVPGVRRDANGKIHRSAAARDQFKHSHPCPSTGKTSGACPGYVIDHVQALKHGGVDAPSNMQWQTTAAAKAKDKSE
jgi:hypothetical protein